VLIARVRAKTMTACADDVTLLQLFCDDIDFVGRAHHRSNAFDLRASDVIEIHRYRRPLLPAISAGLVLEGIDEGARFLS